MRVGIVGGGPTGLFLAATLARRGHRVTVVERDAGPQADGSWRRRGVMQFELAHVFRPQVAEALVAELPEVWDALLTAGAVPATVPRPDGAGLLTGLRCRRPVFERVLRDAAQAEPGVRVRVGHADQVLVEGDRVAGLRVDGGRLETDVVIDASGRSGKLSDEFRASAQTLASGLVSTGRQYRLLPGADFGPLSTPFNLVVEQADYQVMVFPHDNRTFSTVILRTAADAAAVDLRRPAAYEAASQAIPTLAEWVGPDRCEPISPVLIGAALINSYRGQPGRAGHAAGLIAVGDAVCTTNPASGRGVATSFIQARELLRLLDHDADLSACSAAFDGWCRDQIQPWFTDQLIIDAARLRRWAGDPLDLARPLPSDLVVAAALRRDPALIPQVLPYLWMLGLPSTLDAVQPRAREIYAGGWRPPAPGPSHDELAAQINATTP